MQANPGCHTSPSPQARAQHDIREGGQRVKVQLAKPSPEPKLSLTPKPQLSLSLQACPPPARCWHALDTPPLPRPRARAPDPTGEGLSHPPGQGDAPPPPPYHAIRDVRQVNTPYPHHPRAQRTGPHPLFGGGGGSGSGSTT